MKKRFTVPLLNEQNKSDCIWKLPLLKPSLQMLILGCYGCRATPGGQFTDLQETVLNILVET